MTYRSTKLTRTNRAFYRNTDCIKVDEVPNQFCNYMKNVNSRFNEICDLYLQGLSMDDIKYLEPEDFIKLVPKEHYQHRLLMTIMVRRYLFKNEEECNSDNQSTHSSNFSLNNENNPKCNLNNNFGSNKTIEIEVKKPSEFFNSN